MQITTEQIKELRDATGISVMQCKKALEQAEGDMAKALEILREESAKIAAKKGDRELASGVVASYIHNTKTTGCIVELSCETDFVSKNEEFTQLASELAMHITAFAPESVEDLLMQPFILNGDVTVGVRLDEAMQKFGERTVVSRFERYSFGE
jgi:elongation factor Ts